MINRCNSLDGPRPVTRISSGLDIDNNPIEVNSLCSIILNGYKSQITKILRHGPSQIIFNNFNFKNTLSFFATVRDCEVHQASGEYIGVGWLRKCFLSARDLQLLLHL